MQKFIFGLLLLMPLITYSQYKVSGIVLNEDSAEPIIGATVVLQQTDKATVTDLDGNFSFENLPEGQYTLIVSSLGFGTTTLKTTVPVEDQLEILLSPTAIEIEEVIISTPFHQLQSDNIMKVERATLAELNRTGSMNLSESMSKIAGVETATTGSGIGKPVVRGLSANRVLVYAQGVRLENQQFGDEHGLGVNSSGTESVEVIKGPASLLYGSDALGGVIYLNPEKYAPAGSTMADFGSTYYSNTLGTEANGGVKTSGDNLKFLVRGNYAAHSDYETGDGERVTNSRYEEWDLKSGLGYSSRKYKGDLRYNLNSSHTGIPEAIGQQSTSKDVMEPYQSVQNHILSLDNSFYFKGSSLDVKIGYLFNNRKEFEEEHEEEEHEEEGHEEEGHEEEGHELHEGEPALQMHLETLNYDAKYNLPKMGDFETIIGVQGMYQTNTNLGEEILIPDATIADVGLLATTHYHLEKLDFQAGIRFDNRNIESEAMGDPSTEEFIEKISRNFNSYNGAFGVKADLTPRFTGRLNLSSGFRAPNLAELTSKGSHHGTNRYEVGNPDLENEQNYQLDLALEYRNKHFEFFTNAFYNRLDNYIYLQPTGERIEENPVFDYVQNNAELYGGEAGIHLHPHPLDWLHFESSYELVIGKQENGNNLPLIPAQTVQNTFRIEFPDTARFTNSFVSVNLKTTFDQNRAGIFETPTSGYSLLNAGIGSAVDLDQGILHFKVGGNNLLNKTYFSHLSRLKFDGIANMGRNIALSAKLSF